MGLPYTPDPDILAPDDVESASHITRVLAKHNDAVDLVSAQHIADVEDRAFDIHDSTAAPQLHFATVIVVPPNPVTSENEHSVTVLGGPVGDITWTSAPSDVGGVALDYWYLDIMVPDPKKVWFTHAEVSVGFSGTPTSGPPNNLGAVIPKVFHFYSLGLVTIGFNRVDLGAIKQILVLLYGQRVGD